MRDLLGHFSRKSGQVAIWPVQNILTSNDLSRTAERRPYPLEVAKLARRGWPNHDEPARPDVSMAVMSACQSCQSSCRGAAPEMRSIAQVRGALFTVPQ